MSTLHKLLNLGLVEIGSDDLRFEKMQSASVALAAKFEEEPSVLVPATLVALDEMTDENEPLFDLVEELVASEWKTLRNTHVNRPRVLLRSIIIDAIANSAANNAKIAAVVWNTAASPIRHQQVRLGKASTALKDLLTGASKLAENEAVVRAGFVASAPKKRRRKAPSQEKAQFSLSAAINDDDVLPNVARSTGPQHPQSPNLDSPNPHWPNQNQHWANEFATRMATALSKAVNLGNARFAESLGEELARYLGEFEKQLTEQVRDVEQLQSNMVQTHESSRMRLDVLWWSEALYSPLLEVGYRELDSSVAAVAAAIDLSNIVPALSPASVAYILDETLRRAFASTGDNGQPVQDFLDDVTKARVDFGEQLPLTPTNSVRLPLIDLVGEAADGSTVSADTIRQRAGVDPELQLSTGEFAMWIFRCAQANRLVEALR